MRTITGTRQKCEQDISYMSVGYITADLIAQSWGSEKGVGRRDAAAGLDVKTN